MSFNPHTHEGCDSTDKQFGMAKEVSIHTPTKGVTRLVSYCLAVFSVSIHTPTKGVTADY